MAEKCLSRQRRRLMRVEGSAYFMHFRRWAALTQKGREGKRIGMGVAVCPEMELGVSVDGILVSRAELVWFIPPREGGDQPTISSQKCRWCGTGWPLVRSTLQCAQRHRHMTMLYSTIACLLTRSESGSHRKVLKSTGSGYRYPFGILTRSESDPYRDAVYRYLRPLFHSHLVVPPNEQSLENPYFTQSTRQAPRRPSQNPRQRPFAARAPSVPPSPL